MISRGNFIAGKWTKSQGGESTEVTVLDVTAANATAAEATEHEINAAVTAARLAFTNWSQLEFEVRANYLKKFAAEIQKAREKLAVAISEATGKPKWESLQEVDTMIAKVSNSIEAHQERCAETATTQTGFTAVKRYRPHGVVAVLGPFNLPAHLPHSHIVPALLAGNTVVYKPSELTPSIGEWTTMLWEAAGLPAGVLNMLQGGRNTGVTLANHPDLNGLFFTGSYQGGLALSKTFAAHPGKILALELGGNNPLVIWDAADVTSAALLTAQSAFITSGQRCVCARRLILETGERGEAQLKALLELIPRLRVGHYTQMPQPFMGPVISVNAADQLLTAQKRLESLGGKILVPMKRIFPTANLSTLSTDSVKEQKERSAFLTPGLIDMTEATNPPDEEIFGPLLQIFFVKSFSNAIALANHTRFGLAAGLVSDRKELWEEFQKQIRAGVVNWNRQTTGASGKLPFGGIGDSGNHRPSAYYAADYCSYPVASIEVPQLGKLETPIGIDPL